jgi:hypothetical protein
MWESGPTILASDRRDWRRHPNILPETPVCLPRRGNRHRRGRLLRETFRHHLATFLPGRRRAPRHRRGHATKQCRQ